MPAPRRIRIGLAEGVVIFGIKPAPGDTEMASLPVAVYAPFYSRYYGDGTAAVAYDRTPFKEGLVAAQEHAMAICRQLGEASVDGEMIMNVDPAESLFVENTPLHLRNNMEI